MISLQSFKDRHEISIATSFRPIMVGFNIAAKSWKPERFDGRGSTKPGMCGDDLSTLCDDKVLWLTLSLLDSYPHLQRTIWCMLTTASNLIETRLYFLKFCYHYKTILLSHFHIIIGFSASKDVVATSRSSCVGSIQGL